MEVLFRRIALSLFYLYQKFSLRNIVDMRGMTVIYHDKNSSITLNVSTKKKRICFLSDTFSNMGGISQRCNIIARHGGHIEIGEGTAMSGSSIYSMASIKIGKDVLIGVSCKIYDNDFHPLRPELRTPYDSETIGKSPIEIGDGCFIGANSIILKGTRLGKNCVVGAGSVVRGAWPDDSIIAGNPAKFIKRNEPVS